jgi:hypothetical protein
MSWVKRVAGSRPVQQTAGLLAAIYPIARAYGIADRVQGEGSGT